MAICLLFLAAQTYSFRANTVPCGNVIGVGGGKNVQGCVQMCGRGHRLPFFPSHFMMNMRRSSWMTSGTAPGRHLPPVCWRAGRTSARYHSSHADDISMRKAC